RELKRDIGTRLFKFRGNLDEELNHYHPKGKMIISSFVDGVNAYIDWINGHQDQLPVEFRLLKIKPQPWTPEVVISRHQGLLGNIEDELDIGRMIHLVGEQKVREILWFHPFDPVLKMDNQINTAHLLNDILELYKAYRKPVRFRSDDFGYQNQTPDYRRSMFWEGRDNLGSNNWVITGEHTQSGYPMMANDPHRTLAVPSLRYMAHLVGPGWNVIGGGEPEIPGISIGHNEYGAWGLTVFSTDAEDLYVYRLNPEDPDQYWHNGRWLKMDVIPETIPVKGQSPVTVDLKYTLHGPVVFQDSTENIGYAVKCGWMEAGGAPYLASLRMDQSFDFESFRDACNYSHIPGENMVWADPGGNIGWQAVGIAPVRTNFSGLVPIPGDGTHEWSGYLEIRKKPNQYNPASGIIITANENLTDLSYPYPEAIGYEWTDPMRGDRIAEYFGQRKKLNMIDMMEIQNDHLSIVARSLVPYLKDIEISDSKTDELRKILLDWDYKMEIESIAATIYNEWEKSLKQALKEIKVPSSIWKYFGSFQAKKLLDFITFPDGDFGDDPLQARDDLLIQCLSRASDRLEERLGTDVTKWQYGQERYKHVLFNHALGSYVSEEIRSELNVGPLPRGGSNMTVGNTGSNLNQSSGATFKIICDTESWDRSLAINAPGQSGDPGNRHYDDLFPVWANDRYFPLFYSRERVESVLDQVIYLVPQ
ncbi:MAG: penicillin acylase family protein, partial [Saprospiraceae bacterium]|nr:penicillin acylase family protein [Saprospiraceae bacterium]